MNRDTIGKIASRLDKLSPEDVRQLFLRLASEKGLLQEVFDALRDGIILFDADGSARFANKAAETIYGRPLRELLKEPFERLAGGSCTWQELCASKAAIVRDVHVNYPASRQYNFYISPLAEGTEYLLLVRDDTELLERHEENAEAEQFNLLTFLAGAVAHEIGNPLNSLGLSLQLIQRKLRKLGPEAEETLSNLLEEALHETHRLDTLLHQFLESMRPAHLHRSKVQVNEIISRVLDLLTGEIRERGAAVQSALVEDLPEISADADRLFQVFYNLIRNALQSLPGTEGGISIQTRYNDSDIGIIIGDNGSGISHEVMGNMYQPFRTTKKKGHGLGLLIVRHIVKEHGGTLSITSKEGLGTTITITLPRADRMTRLLPA